MSDLCPFHDRPPAEVVHVQFDGGMTLPYTAERLCSEWHLAEALRPSYEKAMAAIADAVDRQMAE